MNFLYNYTEDFSRIMFKENTTVFSFFFILLQSYKDYDQRENIDNKNESYIFSANFKYEHNAQITRGY